MQPIREPFRPRETDRLKVKGWKMIFRVNGNQKKTRMANPYLKKNRL